MSRLFQFFSFFLFLSLLLHLGVGFYFAHRPKTQKTSQPLPFFVELREAQGKPRELDLPQSPDQQRSTRAKRLGPSDQVAPKETAPKGTDVRDLSPRQPRSLLPPAVPTSHVSRSAPETPTSPKGTLPSPLQSQPPALPYSDLLKATERAAQNIAELDPDLRRRLREDVQSGQAVFLDTERDLLGSFFQRFRKSVEDVWAYPRQSVTAGESGICLYKIVVNRAGVLVNPPELLKSSGFPLLDTAAADAIRDASPSFGFLPNAYPKETLTIFAYFEYRLGGVRSIYGERY